MLATATADASDAQKTSDQMQERFQPAPKPLQRSRPKVRAYEGGNDWVSFGVGESRGYRADMQDMHAVHLDLQSEGQASTALFAVFDGHGGSEVAKFCAEAVAQTLQRSLAFSTASGPMSAALRECMLLLDEEVLKRFPKRQGSTATLALLRSNELVVGGVGDSKCILARDGQPVVLTIDHKPTHPKEEMRIRQAGGFVAMGRVGADLNISRAIGDGQYKENDSLPAEAQMVSAEPDISQVWLDARDHWLLVASDGLWNSLKEAEVMKYVYKSLEEGKSLGAIAKGITQACNSPSKSAGDNVTVCIVRPTKLPAQPAASPSPSVGAGTSHSHTPSAPAAIEAAADEAAGGSSGEEKFVVLGAGQQQEAVAAALAERAGAAQGAGAAKEPSTAQQAGAAGGAVAASVARLASNAQGQMGSAQAGSTTQGDGVQQPAAAASDPQKLGKAGPSTVQAGYAPTPAGTTTPAAAQVPAATHASARAAGSAGPAAVAGPGGQAAGVPVTQAVTQPSSGAVATYTKLQQQQDLQHTGRRLLISDTPAAAAADWAGAMGTGASGVQPPAGATGPLQTPTSKANAAFFKSL